jgi:hypothetical protein
MTRFQELSLLEQTQRLKDVQLKMSSLGCPNMSDAEILRLCESNYHSGSTDLDMLGKGLTSVDELVNARGKYTAPKQASPEVKPIQSWTELTDYDRQVRIDQLARFYQQNYPNQAISNDGIIKGAEVCYNQEIRSIVNSRTAETDTYNLTEASQKFTEQSRIDEAKKRSVIDSYNTQTQPNYY